MEQRQTNHTLDELVERLKTAVACSQAGAGRGVPIGLVVNEIGVIFRQGVEPDSARAKEVLRNLAGSDPRDNVRWIAQQCLNNGGDTPLVPAMAN